MFHFLRRSAPPVFLVALLASVLGAASPGTVRGVFALQGGTATTAGYLRGGQVGSDPLARRIETWLTPLGSTAPIRTYDTDMTKKEHMIVVSDDFRTFLHVHPVLQADGRFALDLLLPRPALYHIYSDSQPTGYAKQVFRFDIDAGRWARPVERDVSERGLQRQAGPYVVRLSATTLRAGTDAHLDIHISKGGIPARDLHPYLGALAHAVFLNTRDLSYVHAHPMPLSSHDAIGHMPAAAEQMPSLPSSAISAPNMMLHVALTEPGTYKLWLQFRGGSQLYVAAFVVTVK